jgi:hypothetical protein
VILGFDAADYLCEVWLNDVKVGEHEGGYLPFEFDVTGAARPGANILTVRVDDPPSLFPEIPHGKQGWYGPLSGLWQPVWIEHRPALFIKDLQVKSDLDSSFLEAQVILSSPVEHCHQLTALVRDPGGDSVATSWVNIPVQTRSARLSLTVETPQPWSPETPNLYRLEICLEDEQGKPVDQQSKPFGFRKVESRDGRLYLNDQPLYLRAALDQDYYLDSIYTTPDTSFLEDQLRKAKEMGLNCLRCHIKVADPRYYDVADRLGMLIWTELPNWSTFTVQAGARGRETLLGILERDGHHPSIIIWTIINENWGMDLANDANQRAWLKDTYHWLKALDPARLVVDNSPCISNFHVESDLDDYHFYRSIPDQRKEWDQIIAEFASRPAWTYSQNGDQVRSGKEPLIVSEFGNWGLPDADLLVDQQGRDPWWFQTGLDWSQGVVYPQGVRQRFRNLGLDRPFGSWKKFVEATQWQQYLALKYEIEVMRRYPEICGYVITELTDVHWECNGLLDMARNPKVFTGELAKLNADTVIIPTWERVAYWSGETVQIGLTLSHVGGQPLPPARLTWRLDTGETAGEFATPIMKMGQVLPIANLSLTAPELPEPAVAHLLFELRTPDGKLLASNSLNLSIQPRRQPPQQVGILWAADRELRERLQHLGYATTPDLETADLVVTSKIDDRLLAHLCDGGRLLVLADRAGCTGRVLPGIQLVARQGTPWIGDWASAFSWVVRKGPFARLPGGPLVDHSFDRTIPEYVLTGFREWDYHMLVHAGEFVGWIHKPAVMIGERHYGKGRAVLNTFRLENEAVGVDPTSTALLEGLIELALR